MFEKVDGELSIHQKTGTKGYYDPCVVSSTDNFIVTWTDKGPYSTNTGIEAQKHTTTALITDMEVTETIVREHKQSKVASLENGSFVVTWCSDGKDGSGYGIYARIYNSMNIAQGEEFRVNSYFLSNQEYPSIASLTTGGFVIGWQSIGQDTKGISSGIYAQRYSDTGTALGTEFRVNDYVADNQEYPSVTGLSTGEFVITWQSFGQDGSGRGIYAKKYNNDGTAEAEFRVNTYIIRNQEYPSVAGLTNGEFIIAWQSFEQDGSRHGVYAQKYHNNCTASGGEFQVNSYFANSQKYPSVTGLPTGGFVVAWQSFGQDTSTYGIYAKKYNNDGTMSGNEFQVNSYVGGNQEKPSITSFSDGTVLIVWQSFGQYGYNFEIHGQRYKNDILSPATETPIPTVAATHFMSTDVPVTEAAIVATKDATLAPAPPTTQSSQPIPNKVATNIPVTEVVTKVVTLAPASPTTQSPQPIPNKVATDISVTEATIVATKAATAPAQTPQPIPNKIATDVPVTGAAIVSTKVVALAPAPPTTQSPQLIPNKVATDVPVTEAVITKVVTLLPAAPTTQIPQTMVTNDHITTAPSLTPLPTVDSEIIIRYINETGVSLLRGTSEAEEFVVSNDIKNLTIYGGGGIDSFTFTPSTNSIIEIADFENSGTITLNNFTSVISYSDLNITRGSVHINLPENQTIIIRNKYPEDLNASNFVFGNINPINTTVLQEQVSDQSSDWWKYATIAAGSVIVIAAISLCVYKFTTKSAHNTVVDIKNEPFGNNRDGDQRNNEPFGNEVNNDNYNVDSPCSIEISSQASGNDEDVLSSPGIIVSIPSPTQCGFTEGEDLPNSPFSIEAFSEEDALSGETQEKEVE